MRAAIEAGLLNPDWTGSQSTSGGPLVNTFRVALDETAILDQLGRYEARLDRAFHLVVLMLERRQARRRERDGRIINELVKTEGEA